jgi:cytidine deaminase
MQSDLPERCLPRSGGNELLGILRMTTDDLVVGEMRVAAEAAMNNAYCRYSDFRVGAAVLTADGQIFAGCNVENASYGLTICAERNAIFQAVANGALAKERNLKAVVIVTPATKLTRPCGACRQVIHEFCEEADADIFIFGQSGSTSFKLSKLLPEAFGPKDIFGQ